MALPAWRSHLLALGPNGERWMESLPSTLEHAVARWDLEVGQPVSVSPWSVVLRAGRGEEGVILKVAVPSQHLTQQARVLAAADGRGYARLLDADLDRGILLLEELGPSLADEFSDAFGHVPAALVDMDAMSDPTARVVVAALRRAWELPLEVAPPATPETHKAAQLRRHIEELSWRHDVSAHGLAIQRALLYCDQRLVGCQPETHVVCHGDPHPGNLLAVPAPRVGAEAGYVWVDPDGFRCEREYDLGVVMRDANRYVLAWDDPVVTLRRWCAVLAEETDTDAEAIWQWAFAERVSTGLTLLDHGMADEGEMFLRAGSRLVGFGRERR